jgi:hypothetical protein
LQSGRSGRIPPAEPAMADSKQSLIQRALQDSRPKSLNTRFFLDKITL